MKAEEKHLVECFRLLLQYHANSERDGTKNLFPLVLNHDLESIRQSIKANSANLNKPYHSGWTLLPNAVFVDNLKPVFLLLSQYFIVVATADSALYTALHLSIVVDSAAVLHMLLEMCISWTTAQAVVCFFCVWCDHKDTLRV